MRRASAAFELIERGEDGPLLLSLVVWPPLGPLQEQTPGDPLGARSRLWPPEVQAEALRLVDAGCSCAAAARQVLGRDDPTASDRRSDGGCRQSGGSDSRPLPPSGS